MLTSPKKIGEVSIMRLLLQILIKECLEMSRVMYFKLGKGYYFEPAEVAEKGLADLCTLIGCDLVEPVYFTVRGVEYTL